MRKQAELLEAKMKAGGIKKKTPLIKKEVIQQNHNLDSTILFFCICQKKGFDSADYFQNKDGDSSQPK